MKRRKRLQLTLYSLKRRIGDVPVTPRKSKPIAVVAPHVVELADAPSPTGRLADRIRVLRQRCIEGLGLEKFQEAHRYIKALQDDDDFGFDQIGDPESADSRLVAILGPEKHHYSTLIDQLIFMEDTYNFS